MALYDEVVRTPGYIQGENFTALADFVTLLSNHFPVLSFTTDSRRAKRTSSTVALSFLPSIPRVQILKSSERARLVFSHLREFMDSRRSQRIVSTDDYRRQFENVEVFEYFGLPHSHTSASICQSLPCQRHLATLPRKQPNVPRLHLRTMDHLPRPHGPHVHRYDQRRTSGCTETAERHPGKMRWPRGRQGIRFRDGSRDTSAVNTVRTTLCT